MAFFTPNLSEKGRIVRGVLGLALIGAGIFAAFHLLWAGILLMLAGAFALFEAWRGWCAVRACGIKTKV